MTRLIKIPFKLERPTPPFGDDTIRYPEALVRHFIQKYTKPKSKVFDPFTGLGTTLFVAEEMGRTPYGIEADTQRHAWTAGQLEHWQNVINGDAAKMQQYGFPQFDFCMTSPPYMPKHHKWNPLFAGNPKHAGYDKYLKQMGRIFGLVAAHMKKGATLIVQADNLHHGRIYTPLVRDLSMCIEPHFKPTDEIIIEWQNPKPNYAHTHCLVFTK